MLISKPRISLACTVRGAGHGAILFKPDAADLWISTQLVVSVCELVNTTLTNTIGRGGWITFDPIPGDACLGFDTLTVTR